MANDQRKLIADWFKAWNSRDAEKLPVFILKMAVSKKCPRGKYSR